MMKTQNKRLAALLCLLTLALCVIGLTSCDIGSVCVHEWSEYTVTEAATCTAEGSQQRTCKKCGEAETQKISPLGHTPGEDDGDCTTPVLCLNCGKETTKAKSKHRGGTATCTSLATCTTCGKEYGELLEHLPEDDDGDCTTPVLCAGCGNVTTEANAAHTGGTANCKTLAKCEVCGKEYGALLPHVPNEDDGDCATEITCSVCGDVTTAANEGHYGGTATCETLAKCIVCGKEYGVLAPHSPIADDGDCTTAITCLVCGDVSVEANATHTGGAASCEALAQCEVCGKEYGELAPHSPIADDGDCTTAITCSVCGEVMIQANEAHTGGAASCEALAQCEVCGKEYGELAPHTPVADDGDCTTAITCSACGEVMIQANEAHTGGTASCEALAQCEVCGKEYGFFGAHIPEEDDGDCTTAINCSVCGEVTTQATENHIGGTATCKELARCAICDTEYGELAEHGESVFMKHLDTHYLVCPCCYLKMSEPEAHELVDGACTECGFNPTITLESVEAAPGDTQVTIAISIADNPGITGLMLTLQYNSDALTLTDAQSGEALSALTFTAPAELTNGCSFMWDGVEINDEDIKDGELLILTFDISPDAFEGNYSILLKANAYDNDLTPFTLIIKGGSISITND